MHRAQQNRDTKPPSCWDHLSAWGTSCVLPTAPNSQIDSNLTALASGDVWKRVAGEVSSEQEQLKCVSACVLYSVPSSVKYEKMVILIDMFHFFNGFDIYMTHLYLNSYLDTVNIREVRLL